MLARTMLIAFASGALLTVGIAGAFAETAVPKGKAAPKAATTTTTAATPAVFPKAIDAKYSKEKAGTGMLHTCRDQYNANKAANANGGLKWIQKGGGYWSECDKHLKGA
jgi:hypothetical protein